MKMKITVLGICLCFIAVPSFGQITGSAHDFSASGWTTEICAACHTPHNADTTVADSPLWNHEVTAATFTVYSNPRLDAVVGQPDGVSKLCLSCHDGTVALDSFGGATGTNFLTSTDPGYVGIDLGNDHPISFTYDAALFSADGGLFDPATVPSGLGGTINDDLLIGGKLECSSCHDVHNAGFSSLLVKSNTGSDLCMTCHDK